MNRGTLQLLCELSATAANEDVLTLVKAGQQSSASKLTGLIEDLSPAARHELAALFFMGREAIENRSFLKGAAAQAAKEGMRIEGWNPRSREEYLEAVKLHGFQDDAHYLGSRDLHVCVPMAKRVLEIYELDWTPEKGD